jgi:large subunit ribosomal protein LP2
MKELAAYLLLVLGGNETPSEEDVTTLISSVGGEANADSLASLFADLSGKDIHQLLAEGEERLKSVVAVGGAAPAGGKEAGSSFSYLY